MRNPSQPALWPTLKRLLAYGSPWRKSIIKAVIMLWVASAAEVSGPALISYFIDHLVAEKQLPLAMIGGLAAAYILLQGWPHCCITLRLCCLTRRLWGLCNNCVLM